MALGCLGVVEAGDAVRSLRLDVCPFRSYDFDRHELLERTVADAADMALAELAAAQ